MKSVTTGFFVLVVGSKFTRSLKQMRSPLRKRVSAAGKLEGSP